MLELITSSSTPIIANLPRADQHHDALTFPCRVGPLRRRSPEHRYPDLIRVQNRHVGHTDGVADDPNPDVDDARGRRHDADGAGVLRTHRDYDVRGQVRPTNIVRDHDGQGLRWNYLDDSAAGVVVGRLSEDDGDAAAKCCQACVDNADCAAMEVNTAGTCSLYFDRDASSQHAVCGAVGFTYRSFPNIWHGQGIWVQSGCGEARCLAPGQ
ncbi:hypothetical protein PG994_005204 [Apiospora phragmitis]|uniref:Apple domain-containing protein n=1 Tax=Apiospora phragmitis TaxID=2905665 RepID=A0ABR1VSS4_9PEZI